MQQITQIVRELETLLAHLKPSEVTALVQAIVHTRKIFVAGAGRSGLMMRAFAVRLNHLGLPVFVVGETTSPPITGQDLLLIGSGSGETQSLVGYARQARQVFGARVGVITATPGSTLARLADYMVELPLAGSEEERQAGRIHSDQPLGSLFEQGLLLTLDAMVVILMTDLAVDSATLLRNHANLE